MNRPTFYANDPVAEAEQLAEVLLAEERQAQERGAFGLDPVLSGGAVTHASASPGLVVGYGGTIPMLATTLRALGTEPFIIEDKSGDGKVSRIRVSVDPAGHICVRMLTGYILHGWRGGLLLLAYIVVLGGGASAGTNLLMKHVDPVLEAWPLVSLFTGLLSLVLLYVAGFVAMVQSVNLFSRVWPKLGFRYFGESIYLHNIQDEQIVRVVTAGMADEVVRRAHLRNAERHVLALKQGRVGRDYWQAAAQYGKATITAGSETSPLHAQG